MDKIPEGPGLVVFYHGAFPLDYYYFVSRLHLQTGRFCHTVVDYHFSKIPGIKLFYKVQGLTHDGRVECVEIMKNGCLLGVLPGGAREALFSDENYGLLWGNRTGFAHVARDAKVIKTAIKELRDKHQKIPGSIQRALLERFHKYPKDN
uniref:Phospholipid/glycerol acyltransferase domain-containing protein n=2 Tax=Varanus komodoensis TaxID=61221 RepID=A0A8D2IMI9_VARKO